MATLSMLLLIVGTGGVLLGLAWAVAGGPMMANLKPALLGLVLCGVGIALPIGGLDDGARPEDPGPPPDLPPPMQPGTQPPPGNFPIGVDGRHPQGMHNPGRSTQELSLATAPSVVTRARFACKTDAAGTAQCWGEPVPLRDLPVTKIVLGREHGCALLTTGALSCWGEAQLGASRLSQQRFVDIAATLETICGITQQGALHCFGADLGMPEPGQRFVEISGGAAHFCALAEDGKPSCWGDNSDGQTAVPEGLVLSQISAGHFNSCGLDAQGAPHCWGRNVEGQSRPPEDLRLQSISTGWAHSCGLDAAGYAQCWGCDTRHADLLIGDACAPPSARLQAISAGDLWRSCAIDLAGETLCWGGMARIGGPS